MLTNFHEVYMITFSQFLLNEQDDSNVQQNTDVDVSKVVRKARDVVKTGVNRLLKMDHPQKGESDEQHAKRSVDAYDIIEAMEVLRKFFGDTEDAVGMKARQGDKEFNYLKEIRDMVDEYYLRGDTEVKGALNRRKYRAMIQVLVNPMLDLFRFMTHEEALKNYNDVLDGVIQYVKNSDVVASADDAFVQRRLIQKEVQRSNKVARAVDGIMALRNKKRKKKS